MFIEVIPLQYEMWHKHMSSTRNLGEISGIPQLLHSNNRVLRDYDADMNDMYLTSSMAHGGGHAAYRCAQLFALEAYLDQKYAQEAGDRGKFLPRLVTGFWRMYELEFRAKPPTYFQDIPKIELTLALDFGCKSKSEPHVRSLLKTYESEGEICVVSVPEENWGDQVCTEIEMRFGFALHAHSARSQSLFEQGNSGDTDSSSDSDEPLGKDVPF